MLANVEGEIILQVLSLYHCEMPHEKMAKTKIQARDKSL
jgi:hypothetical protein